MSIATAFFFTPQPPGALRARFINRLPMGSFWRLRAASALTWCGVWVAAFLLAMDSAHAKRVALVVGNASYQVGRLTNPPNDVAEMERALKAVGFSVQKVLNANQNQMKRAVRDFGTAAQGAEVAFVYFSGHGTQANGENYLLPLGASIDKESDYPIEAIAANDVLAQIRGAQPKAAILVLDACRDNPLAATTKSTTKGLGRMIAPTGSLIAFATEPNTTASDNGNYAKVLAREIQKPGQELLDVFRNTGAEVKRLSGGKQEPRISEVSINERLYLAGQGTQVASVAPVPTGQPVQVQADPEQEAWELAKRRDTVAAYEGFLASFPSGRLAATARSALAGLKPASASTPTPQPTQPQATASAQPRAFKDCAGLHCPEMVVIPAGSPMMGSSAAEQELAQKAGAKKEWTDPENPRHKVTLRSFALGKYEVTQGQWRAVMGNDNPSHFISTCGDNCPVERVSWDDIQIYIQKLNRMTGQQYRLPSEAEWEYAARAGCTSAFNVAGQCKDRIEPGEANFDGNFTYNGSSKGLYREKTMAVGSFAPNGFGLHDMHGNVWEWVQDCYEDDYRKGQPVDGSAHRGNDRSCSYRVLRGGSWNILPFNLRAANRDRNSPDGRNDDGGFRLARMLP